MSSRFKNKICFETIMNSDPEDIRGIIQKARPNLRPSSITQYDANLRKVRSLFDADSYNFLKSPSKVEDKIKDLHFTTRRNILNAIIVFLLAIDKDSKMEKLISEYSEVRDELNQKYIDDNKSGIISEKQKVNFAKMEEIDDMVERLRLEVNALRKKNKMTQNDISRLRAYVIFSMLKRLPTRNDMSGMKLINQTMYKKLTQEEKEANNFLVDQKTKMKFVYNVYKTSKKYGENIIEVPEDLKPILRMYIKTMGIKNGDVMFDMTRNAISQLLTKQSQRLISKKISSTMMRKIYLSDKYSEVNEEKEKDSKIMMHDVNTANLVYTKKSD